MARMSAIRTRTVTVLPARDFARRREATRSCEGRLEHAFDAPLAAKRRLRSCRARMMLGSDLARIAVPGQRRKLFAHGRAEQASMTRPGVLAS